MKSPTTQTALAAQLGISRQTLSTWKRGGMDTSDGNLPALLERAATADNKTGTSSEIQAARLRKLTAEADKMEFALAVEHGNYVTKESQLRAGLAVGQLIKELVLKIPAELPQALIGLEYSEAVKRCEDYADLILATLADVQSTDMN